MNKKFLLLSFFLITSLLLVTTSNVTSKIASPPAGNAADPNSNQTCARATCHNGPAQAASLSTLAFLAGTGVIPTDTINLVSPTFKYVPGTLYNLTFKLNSFTGVYGFQTVALKANNTQAGVMATTAGTTQINSAGGRSYMGHKSASGTKTWTFKWTAPAAGTGPVTFYYAYNTGDGDGEPVGDVIYNGLSTIQESTGTGINDISDKISALNVFPNPISNEFSLAFDLKNAEEVSSQLISLDGKVVSELLNEKVSEGNFNRQFNTNDLPAGIYLLKLNVGNSFTTKKIVKQ